MGDKKRRAPVPPSYHTNGTHGGGREILNPAYVEPEPQMQTPRMSLPLPDYETLFPQKRHGVQGQTRWDHIIAEVNQKHRDDHIQFSGKEVSVDGPVERKTPANDRSSTPVQQYQPHTQTQALKPPSTKSVAAPDPPKKVAPPPPPQYKSTVEASHISSRNSSQNRSSVGGSDTLQKPVIADRTSGDIGSSRKVLHPSSTVQAPRPKSPVAMDRSPQGSLRITQTTENREAPTAKPRQKPNSRDSVLISENSSDIKMSERKVPGIESDPPFLSRDSKTQQFQEVYLFTDNNEKKPEEQGKTDEPDNIFTTDNTSEPFIVSNEEISQPKEYKSYTQSDYDRDDSFTSHRFTSEPLSVVLEEPAAGNLVGGKSPIRAWVSPSEVQPVSAQSSSGGLALSQRRPHPVKPLNPADSHQPTSTPAFKEIKVQDSAPTKHKVLGTSGSGPYTQLTQEELITLVVKQQVDLSKKDAKIVELEEYIDNLLVRVIEEKPSILQSLDAKPT